MRIALSMNMSWLSKIVSKGGAVLIKQALPPTVKNNIGVGVEIGVVAGGQPPPWD